MLEYWIQALSWTLNTSILLFFYTKLVFYINTNWLRLEFILVFLICMTVLFISVVIFCDRIAIFIVSNTHTQVLVRESSNFSGRSAGPAETGQPRQDPLWQRWRHQGSSFFNMYEYSIKILFLVPSWTFLKFHEILVFLWIFIVFNRRVPANVFLNTKLVEFLDCSEIPRMSLAPWTGGSGV